MQISTKTGVVQAIAVLLWIFGENNRAEEHGTASIVAADDCVASPPHCERVQATPEPYTFPPWPFLAIILAKNIQEPGMISGVPQKVSAWLIDLSLVTIMGLPPKDPHDDDDENEEDEEDDGEEEERAVIREPDE
jgi:hypothetical protein